MEIDAKAFAKAWEAAWNCHDLDVILSHYAPDIRFSSRKAQALVGSGVLQGQAALRDYWGKALARQPDLHFTVLDVFEGAGMLALSYRNHRGVLAMEHFRFGEDGRVIEASACHEVAE